jgi:hypothetical protein
MTNRAMAEDHSEREGRKLQVNWSNLLSFQIPRRAERPPGTRRHIQWPDEAVLNILCCRQPTRVVDKPQEARQAYTQAITGQ